MRPSKISCITDERVISEAVSQSPMSSAKKNSEKTIMRRLSINFGQNTVIPTAGNPLTT